MILKRILSIILVIIAVVNMTLLAMRLIDPLIFWGIIVLLVLYVYFVMPKIK